MYGGNINVGANAPIVVGDILPQNTGLAVVYATGNTSQLNKLFVINKVAVVFGLFKTILS